MLKKFLVAGTILGSCIFVVGTTAVLGVVLGTRTLVVSAAAVKPAAVSIAPTGHIAGVPVVVAMGE